jgi:methyl-accepting chemotaxis protein
LNLVADVRKQEAVIQGAMEEQSTGSVQISQAMQKINTVTHHVRDGLIETLEASKRILVQMDDLAAKTVEMSKNVNDIMGGFNEFGGETRGQAHGELIKSASHIAEFVSQFRF